MRKTVKRLDKLSDILCSVVDTAELVRNVHPEAGWVEGANRAHAVLSNFLNRLNTHSGLYEALKRVLETPSVLATLSPEEHRVATLLMQDFEKSGITMPTSVRQNFVTLQDRILTLGQQFIVNAANPPSQTILIRDPYTRLEGLPRRVIDALVVASGGSRYNRDKAYIPVPSNVALMVLRFVRDEEVRKEVYVALNKGSEEQVAVLEELLRTRGELAKLLQKRSYSEMYLADKMAESPGKPMKQS
ncbi:Mitochondrial intermediate peptidase [Quaeritorhiza haematococci]|nr:Mitochondrial intermediate peptidase [Quaeritorhiza haematococci]